MLQDSAVLTVARSISDEVGAFSREGDASDLGEAKKVLVEKENTTIIDGGGKASRTSKAGSRAIRPQYRRNDFRLMKKTAVARSEALCGGP